MAENVPLIGAHVGAHAEEADPLTEARKRGADLVQFFLGDPQDWKKPKPRVDAEVLRAADIPVYVHAPYVINVATANNRIRIPSRIELADLVGVVREAGAPVICETPNGVEGQAADIEFLREALGSEVGR